MTQGASASIPSSRRPAALAGLFLAAVLTGCGTGGGDASAVSSAVPSADDSELATRIALIDAAVNEWQAAPDLATARTAAEEARNLVVGPAGPFYGDGDGDGMIEGASAVGLLPGLGGEPGLATPAAGACVERDVLGGSWADPADRWAILETAIDEWSALNNTFPALPSHPQRLVGWATLALSSPDIAVVHEYGGHAHLHIEVAVQATTACAP